MTSEGNSIWEYMLRLSPIAGVVSFDRIVGEFAASALRKDAINAQQYAAANSRRLWNYILKAESTQAREGRHRLLVVVDYDSRLFQFSNFSPSNNERFRWAALRWLDKLSDRDYEFAGALAPELAGASYNKVTPPGNEAGIDFISLGRVFGPLKSIHNNSENIRIIGQCKKYSDKVNVGKLREFCNTLNHVRARARDTERHLPNWFVETRGPILGWVVGHSGYQSGAIEMAQNEGIILSDSIGLAEEIISKRIISRCRDGLDLQSKLDSYLNDFKEKLEGAE